MGNCNCCKDQEQSLPPESPSIEIDLAVYELVVFVSQFSDPYFDAGWMDLTDLETNFLIVKLINYLRQNFDGRLLADMLLDIRKEN